ncbi:hypothetical protein RFI_12502 [Reticulomyxa filosa]|uniref:Uncharacterized protein n=1 Tax=Reticulomyxa filosa TaxID=46433 RepID=X6NFW7_RETFI|nr:hypothetical protein RFI_12502 [Reticulomyxa filosa]|eukprot:ETO24654.1 hypothetical protein RFI_12502 [Reticulomyxa filosa]
MHAEDLSNANPLDSGDSKEVVHALFRNLYACRIGFCDVLVQDLRSNEKAKLTTGIHVRKLALFENLLAIETDKSVVVYKNEQNGSNSSRSSNGLTYVMSQQIATGTLSCNLLLISSQHLILCHENWLECLKMEEKAQKVMEWKFTATIRYLKMIGGPKGQELMICGLKTGDVYKMVIGNSNAVLLARHHAAIRCLDLSHSFHRMAIVDDSNQVSIYALKAGETATKPIEIEVMEQNYEEERVTSVAINSYWDELWVYSVSNSIRVKMIGVPTMSKQSAFLLQGTRGSLDMMTIPLFKSMEYLTKMKQFDKAYELACLGANDSEWHYLARHCLAGLEWNIAHKIWSTRNPNRIHKADLHLIQQLEKQTETEIETKTKAQLAMAEMHAFQGEFDQACDIYCRHTQQYLTKALEMYLDLKEWDKAQIIVSLIEKKQTQGDNEDNGKITTTMTTNAIIVKHAQWLWQRRRLKDSYKHEAAKLYCLARDYDNFVRVLMECNDKECQALQTEVMAVKWDLALGSRVAEKLEKIGNFKLAKTIACQIGNYEKAISILMQQNEHNEALQLIREIHNNSTTSAKGNDTRNISEGALFVYYKWLAINGRLEQVLDAFGYDNISNNTRLMDLLFSMTQDALTSKRYLSASYLYWLRCKTKCIHERTNCCQSWLRCSQVLYAYFAIDEYLSSPRTHYLHSSIIVLLNAAHFILSNWHLLPKEISKSIDYVSVLYVLAKQCVALSAFKMLHQVLSKLYHFTLSSERRQDIEYMTLVSRTKKKTCDVNNENEVTVICPRCSFDNLGHCFFQQHNDICFNCKHPYVRCMVSFTVLPLVEFLIAENITHEQALHCLKTGNKSDTDSADMFYQQMMTSPKNPIIADLDVLAQIPAQQVFVIQSATNPPKYYRCIILDARIVLCHNCFQFFDTSKCELGIGNVGSKCPFCHHVF